MNSEDQTLNTWNKIAALYAEKFMEFDLYNDSYDLFCALISEKKSDILEIGCGPGNISKYVLSKLPAINLLGIDRAPNMIQLAKDYNPDAEFLVMDARNIASISSIFSGIICGFCLPYLSKNETSKLISDSHKLLHKKGILYLSFVEGDYSKSGIQTGSTGDSTYFYYYEPKFLLKELKRHNFEALHQIEYQYTRRDNTTEKHIVLIVKK